MVPVKTQLQRNEQMIIELRQMYADYGFAQFRIRKFEEYDLYVRNKDFLNSVNIITFTDTNGKLMALKPDVTLSVVKNSRDIPGTVQKVYYNENIYRVSHRSHMFEEMMQIGIECIGDIDYYSIYEVVMLAAKTLQHISEDSVLVISDLDIVSSIMNNYEIPEDIQKDLLECIGEKNSHTLRRICRENDVDPQCTELLSWMSMIYGRPEDVLPELEEVIGKAQLKEETAETIRVVIEHLNGIMEAFGDSDLRELIRIDFSVVSDVNYYNGLVFNGFIEELPESVLSGGQYDRLMQKMKRKSRAIGFGVYMDRLERILSSDRDTDIDILLLYDKNTDLITLKKTVEDLISRGNTVLAQRTIPKKLTYRTLMQLKDGEVNAVEADA